MKTIVTALGMLAAVASAYNPGRRLHFRGNGTENLTTLTMKTTRLHTVISCAPTVTDCPAHATGLASLPDSQKVTKIVTDTVLATTVRAVTDMPKASGSSNMTADAQGASSQGPAMNTKVTDVVSDKTYTMTMGTGSSASVATRTLRTTLQQTITLPNADATAAPASTGEPTTTVWSTTKATRTVVITRAKHTGTLGISASQPSHGDCPASTVTVTVAEKTVTLPASTVYVTVGAPASCTADQGASKPSWAPSNSQPASAPPNSQSPPTSTPDCDTDSAPTLKHSSIAAPYPTGNGTHPTSGRAMPTGFARLR
ncbi:hypothetical protein E4U41_004904 [Claviceps citrina]|nr:hypothetical protein E4U41_004904 [Claviceps citrina]